MYTSRRVYPLPTGLKRTFPFVQKLDCKICNVNLTASFTPLSTGQKRPFLFKFYYNGHPTAILAPPTGQKRTFPFKKNK